MPVAFCFYTGDCRGSVEIMVDSDESLYVTTDAQNDWNEQTRE